MREAAHYEKISDEKIHCRLCPQECKIPKEKAGFCQVRRNRDGKLNAENYGMISSISLDPIEKKPLYHFYPGKPILSAGTIGCNLACEFCQNWHISREIAPTRPVSPEDLIQLAKKYRLEQENVGLAYTYSEPVVWYEFLLEIMPIARKEGLKNVLVTNAFLNPEPWQRLMQWTDAANIDLKGFNSEYYRRLCHGKLEPVLENIKIASSLIHLELTTLIIPGENDHPDQIEALAKWIAAINPEIPLHLSRYFPNYRLSKPPTPLETMNQVYEIARKNLKFVYLGNLGLKNNTVCPDCGEIWIERDGYQTKIKACRNCPVCNRKIMIEMED